MDGSASYRLIPVTKDNLDLLSKLSANEYFGMPRTVKYLQRFLYNDHIEETRNRPVRGFMVKTAAGELVGMCTFSPCYVYIKQTRKLAYWWGLLGIKKQYWEAVTDLFAAIEKELPSSFSFGNSAANKVSFKLGIVCRGDKPGPIDGSNVYCVYLGKLRYVISILNRIRIPNSRLRALLMDLTWMALKPIRLLVGLTKRPLRLSPGLVIEERHSFDDSLFDPFWKEFLKHNEGIASSRDPHILRHLFGESLAARKLVLLVACRKSKMVGYAILRKHTVAFDYFHIPSAYNYEYADIVALNNDETVLSDLVRYSVWHASRHGIACVSYIGANPGIDRWLRPTLKTVMKMYHQTFSYNCPKGEDELAECLLNNKGWFFGPYDGNRCLGHRGVLDL